MVVITGIGLETGRMAPENAAALVAAGMVSVLVFPLAAFALHRRAEGAAEAEAGAAAEPGEPAEDSL